MEPPIVAPPEPCKPAEKPAPVPCKPQETITLTYSLKSPEESKLSLYAQKQKLADELKASSEAASRKCDTLKRIKTEAQNSSQEKQISSEAASKPAASAPRKKRRKPLQGNEDNRRPMNGFMLFAKSMRIELTKIFPGKDNRY